MNPRQIITAIRRIRAELDRIESSLAGEADMTLREILQSYPDGGIAGLARDIGKSNQAVHQMLAGERAKQPTAMLTEIAKMFGETAVDDAPVTLERLVQAWTSSAQGPR